MFSINEIPQEVVTRRRLIFFFLFLSFYGSGVWLMAGTLSANGLVGIELLLLFLFCVLYFQVAFGFVLSLTGFCMLRRSEGDPLRISNSLPLNSRLTANTSTAVVMPVFNEEPSRVFRGIQLMYESLQKTGQADGFDFFILSDSNDPNHWIEEEKMWIELCKRVNGFGRIFYRKRRVQLNNKSGNIADFCRRWGASYRYMVVLDADSIMTGSCLVHLVALMERNRSVGIIQTSCTLALGASLFRRIQQFAARIYGPIFSAGANFWHLGGGSFWGHNAIIRIKPFMEHCALPELPKAGALGGRILSHDTVEAALMRKAGFGVWYAYDLEGSYEESPPDLLSSLKRDRRWCLGNMQHILVLFAEGFKKASRVHIGMGILSYLCSPLWLLFLILSLVQAFRDTGHRSFSQHGWQNPAYKSALLFALVMLMLLVPKFMGMYQSLAGSSQSARFGGRSKALASVLLETLFSMLLAPILMLFYTKFVYAAFTGLKIKWGKQNRGADRPPIGTVIRTHALQTVIGLGLLFFVSHKLPGMVLWFLPIVAGLILSIPFSHWTSSEYLGELARKKGLFLIPEEVRPPEELRGLDEPLIPSQNPFFKRPEYASDYGLLQAVLDPYIHAIHISLLRQRDVSKEKQQEYSVELRRKLLQQGPGALTKEERSTLLWDASALIWLHKELWISPASRLHEWWQQALRHYNNTIAMSDREKNISAA
ncbi:MAG: glycosyl transferase family 2 [Verrucomicrobiales bacterium]|nr:glycosyl transferase family 2 [Verrucomicrobiales bacterium]